jgi:tetraacyldisaccharide 4'-kinase
LSGDYYRAVVSGEARGLWPALLRGGLSLASLPYACSVYLRNRFYERGRKTCFKVPVPVVSVGNLTLGGTGKTPCVEHVARFYRQQDLRVAILSRGYGSTRGRNDEALVLRENLPDVPHLQGTDRAALAKKAVEELQSEILVLDDGFQHRRLQRDLDVVLVDATNPWGGGHLFPRGLLREPRAGLRRAGLIVLTRCDQVDRPVLHGLHDHVARIAPDVPIAETTHQPTDLLNAERKTAPVGFLAKRLVAAFCGIGNPNAFRHTLIDLGAELCAFRVYPDHHRYRSADVDALERWASQQAKECVVVTTQKDLVKLRLAELSARPLWALRICLQVEAGRDALDRKLWSLVSPS